MRSSASRRRRTSPRTSSGRASIRRSSGELRETGAVTLPSEYDPAGYTYRLSLFEDGKRHLVMRRAIALECPVRLLHGMSDASVPWQTSLRLAERLASRDVVVTLVKDGDHRLSREADLERLGRTLDELLGSVR